MAGQGGDQVAALEASLFARAVPGNVEDEQPADDQEPDDQPADGPSGPSEAGSPE